MVEIEAAERVGQGLAEARPRLVDQDGADPHPLGGRHAAGAALEVIEPALDVAGAQALPALVGAAPLRLGADVEDGQYLEARPVDPQRAQQRERMIAQRRGAASLFVDMQG